MTAVLKNNDKDSVISEDINITNYYSQMKPKRQRQEQEILFISPVTAK